MSGCYSSGVKVGAKTNRGPSAGPENRAALIAAARAIFSEQGVDAPLSAVAKRAGVGQGSLYRHFPDRISLVVAVFDESFAQIDALAADPNSTLRELCDLITHHTEGTAAFFSLIGSDDGPDERMQVFEQRLRAAIEAKWDARDGLMGPNATVDDLILAIGMISGVTQRAPRAHRHEIATAAWELALRGLRA